MLLMFALDSGERVADSEICKRAALLQRQLIIKPHQYQLFSIEKMHFSPSIRKLQTLEDLVLLLNTELNYWQHGFCDCTQLQPRMPLYHGPWGYSEHRGKMLQLYQF